MGKSNQKLKSWLTFDKGFHDCLKYKDGSGGCDGCLNWEGVGVRFGDGTNKFKFEDVGETNNNGLRYTVEVLEHIYTNASFPKDLAPALNISLKASGKSRADLWALATIAAVEYGAETNNMVCDGVSYFNNPGKQCNQEIGTNQCHVIFFVNFYPFLQCATIKFSRKSKHINKTYLGLISMLQGFQECIA